MQTFLKNCLYIDRVSFGYQLQIIKSIFYSVFLGRGNSPILSPFFYDLRMCCLGYDVLSWKFADPWESLKPMLCSIYLEKLRWTMKVWIFNCVSVCDLALDFKPGFCCCSFFNKDNVCYPFYFTFNFAEDHVCQTFFFFELIFFQCCISFIPETLNCLRCYLFRFDIYFL